MRAPRFQRSRRGERRASGSSRRPVRGERALGYVTVSGPGEDGKVELRAQAERISKACRELELSLIQLVVDVEDARSPLDRPGAKRLFERLAAGEASCVVVTTLGWLVSCPDDWRLLRERVDTNVVRLIAIDIGLDTTAEPEVWTGAGDPPGALR
ncbi:MAG TPA: recombinase family protein [Thermoleophilaceae bacterium]